VSERSGGVGGDAGEITELLAAAGGGDRPSLDKVYELVYAELKRLAARQRGNFASADTLSTTALVHEVYLKLAGDRIWAGADRAHFFALAARAMRQILLDHARSQGRQKRGSGAQHVELDGLELGESTPVDELLAIDQALDRLTAVDSELGRLVEWRFFAGLTLEEIAPLVGLSDRTLKRQWRTARAFLYRELGPPGGGPASSAAPA
jgi:RNA polymerase sigma factor (TIGR02999 family)